MNDNAHKILIVDDDSDIVRLISMRLQAASYQVETAASAEEALALFSVSKPQLVITDLRDRKSVV